MNVAGRWREVPTFHRDALAASQLVTGPAIVVEDGATLWVAPGWRGRPDRSGTLELRRSGR